MTVDLLSAARWLLQGRVQGVGFRWSTQRYARGLGVAGWVRNLPDGRVEVVARGTPHQMERLDQFLREGPGSAHVENVEKTSIPHEEVDSNSFVIR